MCLNSYTKWPLKFSCACIFTCFVDHIVTCVLVLMIMFTCMCTWMLKCLCIYMFAYLVDHMLPTLYALLIICYYVACFEDNML